MADPEASQLGAYLKKLRTDRGLSLADVAERLEFDPSYLFRLESGASRKPHPDYLHRLAHFYGVLVEDLYALAGYTPATELPELPTYLRTKYGLTEEAIRELSDFKDFLTERAADERTPPPKPAHRAARRRT